MHLTLQPRLGTRLRPAVLQANFRETLASASAIPAGFTHSRGTGATYLPDENGNWTVRAADVALGGYRGLYVPGAFTDYFHNRNFAGATVGTIGAGGVAPTGATISGGGTNISASVEAVSTWNGLPTLKIRFWGTASGGSKTPYCNFGTTGTANITGITQNTVFRTPMFIRRVAGTWPTTGNARMIGYQYDGSAVYLTTFTANVADPGTDWVRITPTLTASHASVAQVNRPVLQFIVADGASIDVTIEIAAPMCVKTVPTPEIVLLDSGTADVVSNAEDISRALTLAPPFSFRVQGRTPNGIPSALNYMFQLTGATGQIAAYRDDARLVSVNGYASLVSSDIASKTIADNTRFCVAAAVSNPGIKLSIDGGTVVSDADWAPSPAYTALALEEWWGFIESIRIERGAWSDAALQARSVVA